MEPQTSGRRWWGIAAVVIVLVAIGVVAAFAVASRRESPVASPGTTTTTSVLPPTSTSTSPVTVAPADDSAAVWPPASSSTTFGDPTAAARSFAVDFLHFEQATVGTPSGSGDTSEVTVRPQPDGPITKVALRQFTTGHWSVTGATTQDIAVTAPATGSRAASPLTLEGSAIAFEGTVAVEVRDDRDTTAIGTGIVMGGGDASRPFHGTITFTTPRTPAGSVVFFTRSAKDGSVLEAVVVRVRFGG